MMKKPEENIPRVRFVLLITPQTWVRSRQNDAWLFRIPEEDLIANYDIKCYQRKVRLHRYSQYKRDLRKEALRAGFVLPDHDGWFKFFVPMPESWSKKKRARLNFMPKMSKPDTSNYYKAMEDGMKKDDSKIWDFRASRFWYDSPKGYIEVLLPADYQVDQVALNVLRKQVEEDDRKKMHNAQQPVVHIDEIK